MNHILIVDDEPEIRCMVGMIADICAITHDEAENGLVAIEKVQKSVDAGTPYRLILMDINMPKMSGDEACVALSDIAPDIPIVLVSARSESIVKELGLTEFGVRGFLNKPFGVEDMSAILQQFASSDPRISDRRVYTRYNNDNNLVGIARCVTDYHYCCYLSDLAVDKSLQKSGIG